MEFIVTLFAAFILVFGFVKPVVTDSRYIGSGSMAPTLKVGHGPLQKDRVLVNKLAYEFGEQERGDIVLFESVEGGEDDTVELRRGTLYLNGGRQEEPYLKTQDEGSPFVRPRDRARRPRIRDGRPPDPLARLPLLPSRAGREAVLLYWPVGRAGRIQ